MVVIKKYEDENYSVLFNKKTGLLLRVEKKGFNEPEYSKHGPELLDVSITNWCDKGCNYCYRNSNINGKHMSLENYEFILKQTQECDTFQIALGGGNPNQHPNFCEILRLTNQYGIVPSYTTNGRGLSEEILLASKKYCGAVAVSYGEDDYFIKGIELLISKEIKTNIHFILSNQTIDVAIKWLREKPQFLKKINAIVFLNYKPVGKLKKYDNLLNISNKIEEFFNLISKNNYSFKIGFDSCTISYIVNFLKNISPSSIEKCESARFSAFIDENLNMYPCSFMVESYQGVNIKESSILNIWKNSNLFKNFRNFSIPTKCKICNKSNLCGGGCQIFSEINMNCNQK